MNLDWFEHHVEYEARLGEWCAQKIRNFSGLEILATARTYVLAKLLAWEGKILHAWMRERERAKQEKRQLERQSEFFRIKSQHATRSYFGCWPLKLFDVLKLILLLGSDLYAKWFLMQHTIRLLDLKKNLLKVLPNKSLNFTFNYRYLCDLGHQFDTDAGRGSSIVRFSAWELPTGRQ